MCTTFILSLLWNYLVYQKYNDYISPLHKIFVTFIYMKFLSSVLVLLYILQADQCIYKFNFSF